MDDPQIARTERERVTVERADPDPLDRRVVRTERSSVVAEGSPLDTVRRLVWLLFGVLQALLLIRVLLLLLGANEGNQIVDGVLAVTDPFVEPFRGMFQLDSVDGASGSMLDIAALVALVAWTLIEALVLGIIGLADRRPVRA